MKLAIASLITIWTLLPAFGQHQIGITLNAGISLPSNSIIVNIDEVKTKPAPAFQGGFDYTYAPTPKSSFGISALFTRADQRIDQDIKLTDQNSGSVGNARVRSYATHNYISIPVYYKHTFNKLSLNAGIQTSFFISGKLTSSLKTDMQGITDEYEDTYDLIRKSVDVGPRIGASYGFTERLSAQVSIYHGITNIIYDNTNSFTMRNRQLLFGVKYVFFANK